MAPRPPALMVELIEEVLLRFPPDDPASLVCAALVCKEWCRIVAGPGFRRRFRELHRTPPMLGVICEIGEDEGSVISRFIPTSPCPYDDYDHYGYRTLDARHGRVLRCVFAYSGSLEVWDPITGERWEVPGHAYLKAWSFNAAVLCAAHGACDHLDCHHGFLVVLVAYKDGNMYVQVYSSETGGWSEPVFSIHSPNDGVVMSPPALVGNALYFFLDARKSIFKYELHTQNMCVIQLPPDFTLDCAVLTTVEDGALGVVSLEDSRLDLWSMVTGSNGDVGWAKIRVIQLQTLLPVNVTILSDFVGFAHGIGVFLVGTNKGVFSVDLKSHRVRKICDEASDDGYDVIQCVVPIMRFYTPDLRQHGLVAASTK
ncbi:hypothetical protein EJB05_14046 [Eragrostis curvula]|uniref:Uncharacterized protein n=1 Tax=Eragrostis curvula TaxID=38414 RepID=A0A5J9VWG8_9POAL|nr:hypothetical protein EJB05_14046 [Eragrostis curvula]